MDPAVKILAIQFKYFGDAVLMTPALRALHKHYPAAELHLLAPEEITPLFAHLPWLNKVWLMPRRRGTASMGQTWPVIRKLRRERFDLSVDFASNDRGAIASFLVGAKRRLGWDENSGFLGRKFCYTERVPRDRNVLHESLRLAQLLSAWEVPLPRSMESEIQSDPALTDAAAKILPGDDAIVCHVASSQQKKEWPLGHWAKLHQIATAGGFRLVFTTARGEREQSLMVELKTLAPDAIILPLIADLPLFLAVLRRARVFISGDTGPLHFAAGLGVPTISLFGPTAAEVWAPLGERHQALTGGPCRCDGNWAVCRRETHCLAAIQPGQVWDCLKSCQLQPD